MSATEKATTEKETGDRSPLFRLAVGLSTASAIWTAYSCWDLLDRHPMALVAGATYDILWMALVYTEWKSRIKGKKASPIPGWIMLGPVVVLLTWHGHEAWGIAGAIAGPFLAIGTKILWHKAIEDSVDEVVIKKNGTKEEIALLDAETDGIIKKADAEIRKENAEAEAKHKRELEEERRKHELKLARSAYAAEEKRLASQQQSELLVDSVQDTQIRRLIDIIEGQQRGPSEPIKGEIVEQRRSALSPAPQAASKRRPHLLTVKVEDEEEPLSDAQERLKQIAAWYYLKKREAMKQGMDLSKTTHAESMGVTKTQVTRACQKFPLESFTNLDMYCENLKDVG